MSANKLKRQIFDYMRDEYGAMCVRINSGVSRGYVASNHWLAQPNAIDILLESDLFDDLQDVQKYIGTNQTRGFTDTFFMLPNAITIFVETKTKNDRLTLDQKVFILLAQSLGFIAFAVGSVDDLESALAQNGVDSISGNFRW